MVLYQYYQITNYRQSMLDLIFFNLNDLIVEKALESLVPTVPLNSPVSVTYNMIIQVSSFNYKYFKFHTGHHYFIRHDL